MKAATSFEDMLRQCEEAASWDMPASRKEYPHLPPGPGFSPWEFGFLLSVRRQFQAGKSPSTKQLTVLMQLWDRVDVDSNTP